jgi:hypothetical protein
VDFNQKSKMRHFENNVYQSLTSHIWYFSSLQQTQSIIKLLGMLTLYFGIVHPIRSHGSFVLRLWSIGTPGALSYSWDNSVNHISLFQLLSSSPKFFLLWPSIAHETAHNISLSFLLAALSPTNQALVFSQKSDFHHLRPNIFPFIHQFLIGPISLT